MANQLDARRRFFFSFHTFQINMSIEKAHVDNFAIENNFYRKKVIRNKLVSGLEIRIQIVSIENRAIYNETYTSSVTQFLKSDLE